MTATQAPAPTRPAARAGSGPATTGPDGATRLGALVERLSRQSVDKHHDAYVDVPWDDPDLALDPADPRCELFAFDPLAHTDWYRSRTQAERSAIGLHRIAHSMKVGMQFENYLQRGLLSYAMRMDNGDPEFRYCQHEVIEESQHSLMFQEFVNRTGLPVHGMPRWLRSLATVTVPIVNRLSPTLFFMFVLGGEDPIDHIQRRQLREGTTHPLTETIMRIHVTEEARHIAYARTVLRERVPKLTAVQRHALGMAVPAVLGIMAPLMVDPTPELHRAHGVPKRVLAEARTSEAGRRLRRDAVAKQRKLCRELGLMTPGARAVWRRVGLYDEDGAAGSPSSGAASAAK